MTETETQTHLGRLHPNRLDDEFDRQFRVLNPQEVYPCRIAICRLDGAQGEQDVLVAAIGEYELIG